MVPTGTNLMRLLYCGAVISKNTQASIISLPTIVIQHFVVLLYNFGRVHEKKISLTIWRLLKYWKNYLLDGLMPYEIRIDRVHES